MAFKLETLSCVAHVFIHQGSAVRSLNPFSRMSTGLWFVPLMCVLAGVGLSFGTMAIDKAYDYSLSRSRSAAVPTQRWRFWERSRHSMVSLAALVLTITMVVVQLAMGQFSPRIVQRILQDKPSQFAIGVFVGTFAHAMLALREVQTEGEGVVPGLAVVVAFALVIISIMVLVWYVNHIGRKLRVRADRAGGRGHAHCCIGSMPIQVQLRASNDRRLARHTPG